jgi:hypothetical protein
MSHLRRLAAPITALTLLLAIVVLFLPVRFGLAFRAWLVAVGALATAALLRAALAPYRSAPVEPIRLRPRRSPPSARPPGLEEVERAIDFAGWNAADLRSRLRPLLREVAALRLEAGPGVDLERNPVAARTLMGEACWALVSEEFDAPDAGSPAIREALDRLEAI